MDLCRTQKALKQDLRGKDELVHVERVISILPSLLERCGPGSQGRQMILKIARALTRDPPVIYVPCCPDYGHNGKTYTFRGMQGGISLLAQRHISFLEPIARLIPEARVILVLADQEADDEEIVRSVGMDRATFAQRLEESLREMHRVAEAHGWQANFMTERIPNLREAESVFVERIAADPAKRSRLAVESIARLDMYRRINPLMSPEDRLRRTIRTAAQYVAMGTFVASKNALVCNHTTTNFAWYSETGAAVLHDPISVY